MPRIGKEQIRKDEKKILAEFQKNANENLEGLAQRCGFSRQKVWRLIKNLEDNRLIWGYTAIVDDEKNDLHHYTLLIKRTTQQLYEKTINIIVSKKLEDLVTNLGVTIESSYYVHGDYDWVVTFTAPNIREAKRFCDAFMATYPGYFDRMSLMETLFAVRKQHIANPNQKKLKEFLA